MRRLACLIALVLLAQGCGIRGPLYIETPEQKRQAEERRERREAAKQRETKPGTAAAPAATTQAPPPEPQSSVADSPTGRSESRDAPLTDEAFGPSSPPQ
jgi:predicted small lipoprotein YifL